LFSIKDEKDQLDDQFISSYQDIRVQPNNVVLQ